MLLGNHFSLFQCFFIVAFNISWIFSQPSNFLSTITPSGFQNNFEGTWDSVYYCPSLSWATGFDVFYECTYFGIIVLRLYCSDWKGSYKGEIDYYSSIPKGSSYFYGSWNSISSCSSMNYLTGFKIYGCCCPHYNNLAVNDLTMYCSNGNQLNANTKCSDGDSKGWSISYSCPSGTAICGFKALFMDYDSSLFSDNTALNNLIFQCCKICNYKSSVYPTGTTCAFCSMSCLTCTTSATTCDSCEVSDTLTSNQCIQSANLKMIQEEFAGSSGNFATEFSAGGWSTSTGFIQNTCTPWSMIGFFQSTGPIYASKYVNNLLPHYKARIKTRFYKIDNWSAGEYIQILYDNIALTVSELTNMGSDNSFYYGSLCGGSGNENTYFIDKEFVHTATTLTIIYQSNVGASKYWGFSHVGLYIYLCDSTCASCSGPLATDCTSCYTHATLSSGQCTCDNPYYSYIISSPCTSYPCFNCTTCYLGCASCGDQTATSCTSCMTTYYLYATTCVSVCPTTPTPLFGDQSTNTCINSCTSSQYYDTNRVCQPCDSTCLTCSTSALNCNSCTGIRFLEGNTCTQKCSTGYGVVSDHTCKTDCEDQYFEHDVDKLCYIICPAGYFGNVQTKKCTNACPAGQYSDLSSIRCEYCDFNCETCTGSATNCNTCKYSFLVGLLCTVPSYSYPVETQALNIYPMSNSYVAGNNFIVTNGEAGNLANYCGSSYYSSYYILGGPNNVGEVPLTSIEKNYTGLPPHYQARVTFFFIKIDNWNNNSLIFKVDNKVILTNLYFNATTDSSVMKICGDSTYTEARRPVDLLFNHSNAYLHLIITTDLPLTVTRASWGIYDLSVTLLECSLTYCLTCSGPTPSDCLSCVNGLFLQSTAPSTCESICPDGYYSDQINNNCDICDSSCKKCSGASSSECLSCNTGKYLSVSGTSFQCISVCPVGYYGDSDNVCQKCDSTCKTCNGGTQQSCIDCDLPRYLLDNQCFSNCPGSYYGENTTATCIQECPSGTFPYEASKICGPCNNCLKCNGFAINKCTVCASNQYLQEGICVTSCSMDHYVNPGNFSCDSCVSNCGVCNSLTTCSVCSDSYYKVTPYNTSCTVCDGVGKAIDTANKLCVNCLDNCAVCASLNSCQNCINGYYLSSPLKCVIQQYLHAQLISTYNPQIVNIRFSESWTSLFNQMSQYMIIEITDIPSNEYTYVYSFSKTDPIIILTFTFKIAITNGNLLNVYINYTDSPHDEFILLDKNLSARIKPFCPIPQTYLAIISGCVAIDYITPTLKTTTTSNQLQITFSMSYGDLYNLYYASSNLTINTLNASQYTYTITRSSKSNDIFFINLNTSCTISNRPILSLTLNPPDSVLYNTSSTLQLTTYKLQTSLADYYSMDANTKQMVEDAKAGTDAINMAAGGAFSANNLMLGSSIGIKSLVSMDTIRFLRYFLVDYPPPVVAMYQTSMPTSDIIPNVNINENPEDGSLPDIFNSYNLSIYTFNNNGNILIEALVYLSVGLGVLVMIKFSKTTKNNYFRVLLLIFRLVFVWNYALSYFLSNFMNFSLSTFLGYRYPTKRTEIGYFNYFFSIFTGLLMLCGLLFCFLMIKKLRPMLHSKSIEEQEEKKEKALVKEPAKASSSSLSQSNSARPLKDGDNSTVVPDQTSPLYPPIKNNLRSYIEVNDLNGHPILKKDGSRNYEEVHEDEIKNNEKSIFDRTLNDKNIDQRMTDVTAIENSRIIGTMRTQNLKQSTFKKIELENSMSEINKQNSEKPTIKPIILNNPFDNNESIILSDSPKVHDIHLNSYIEAAKDEKPTEIIGQNSTKPGILPYLMKKFSKTFPLNVEMTDLSKSDAKVPWLNRMKLKLQTLMKKDEKTKSDWRRDDIEAWERTLQLLNKSFFPLHRDFKHSRPIQSYFILLDLTRQSLFSLLVVLMFDTPFSGLIIVNLINIAFITGFFIIRPFKERGDFIQNIINELCLLISSFCALILAAMEKFDVVNLDTKMKLGWVMVGVNFFLIIIFLLRIGFNFIMILVLLLKLGCRALLRKLRRKDKVAAEGNSNDEKNKEKNDDQAVLQQIIDIENFLR